MSVPHGSNCGQLSLLSPDLAACCLLQQLGYTAPVLTCSPRVCKDVTICACGTLGACSQAQRVAVTCLPAWLAMPGEHGLRPSSLTSYALKEIHTWCP